MHVDFPIYIIDREAIQMKSRQKGIINADQFFKDRHKLSLKDGKFCIFEHVDENPLFLNNFGMVSKLHRYIYGDAQIPVEEFLNNSNSKLRHIGPYGL